MAPRQPQQARPMQQAIASQQAANFAAAGEANRAELDTSNKLPARILVFMAKSPTENG